METSDRPQPHAIPHVEGTRSLQFPRLSAVLSGDSIAGPFSNTQHRTNARETGLCVTLAQPGGRPQWEEALGPLVDVVVRRHTSYLWKKTPLSRERTLQMASAPP